MMCKALCKELGPKTIYSDHFKQRPYHVCGDFHGLSNTVSVIRSSIEIIVPVTHAQVPSLNEVICSTVWVC